ncbi:MAG: T9SS type A sorting domain-containing protein [Bacteroidia bacterium]|nr:T9SS type A sorting domain-containing protein [Bacteroidia bacterium]
MKQITLLSALFLCSQSVFSQLAEATFSVRTVSVTSYEGGVGGNCWESGDEDYTANIWFRDNVNTGWSGVTCQQGAANGNATYAVDQFLGTRSNTSSWIDPILEAWEDDGDRCNRGSGDDCQLGATDFADVYYRDLAYPSNNSYYSFSGTQWGNGDHKFGIRFTWRYSGSQNAIYPSCNSQSAGYSSGTVKSWSTYLTAGRTYRFGTCGAGEDTYLRIYGSDGYTIVASADDNGPLCSGTAASLDYTAGSSGWYYVEVSRYSRAALTVNGTLTYEDITPAPGNPATFGNNQWLVYGYTGGNNSLNGEYSGYYTETALSYNSLNRWGTNGSPSDASGWQGCYVPADYHVVVSKRQGFPCGIYSFDIPTHDDDIIIYVNGVQVYTHVGCCDVHTNVWTGLLTSTSTVEVRHLDGVGGSSQSLTLNNITTAFNAGSIGGISNTSVCSGTDPGAFTSTAAASGSTSAYATPSYQWESSTTSGTSGFSNISGQTGLTYDPPALTQSTWFRRRATDACGNVLYSNVVQVLVTTSATLSSTYTNESCPSANNGSINVSLSGGMSNVRYIRIQQNKTDGDAFINLAELQAYEIFTGTNVALNKTTSSNSVYNPSFVSANFVNGNTGDLYHSAGTGTNEWVEIDLGAGYNLDNIRIWNRSDCCFNRASNLQLILRNTSNSVVYSQQVDVQQGINSQASPVFNVLDLNWADGATGFNRTGLDAGSYTINYADAAGCTASHNRVIGTTNTESVAPTAITGTTTICAGGSTTLTLSGGTAGSGAVAQWFSGSCGSTVIGTGNSISVSPTVNTTYFVRYAGTCNTTTCASVAVTVNSPSVAPTAISGTTTICAGGSTTLTLSGGTAGTGAVAQWFSGSCGSTVIGTGNSISVSPTVNTTYFVRYAGTCNTTTCASVAVTVNTAPAAFTPSVLTSTPLCYRGNAQISSGGSQSGVTYQLRDNTTNVGASQAGNGSALTFLSTNLTAGSSTYNILASTGAGCTLSVNVPAITVTAAPTAIGNNNDSRTCYVNNNNNFVEFITSNRAIIAVNPGTQDLGNVTVTEYVDGTPIGVQACNTVQPEFMVAALNRRWVISSTVPPVSPVSVRLYLADADVTALAAVANANLNTTDDVSGLGSLELTKYSGPNENSTFTDNCNAGGTVTLHTQGASGSITAPIAGNAIAAGSYVTYSIPGFSELWLNGTSISSPLPVTLHSFDAVCKDGRGLISWSTVSEVNNAYFTVERSADAQSWEVLQTVSGAGNSNSLLMYSVTDERPENGITYYRLRQTDYNGDEELFAEKSIFCTAEDAPALLLFPNPAEEVLNLRFYLDESSDVEMSIYAARGARLQLQKWSAVPEGELARTIVLSDMAPGVYSLRLRIGKGLYTAGFVKR